MSKKLKTVGKSVARINGSEIVTGRMRYSDDIRLSDMLYGRILHSPHAHARIRKLDVSKALALPGVVDVITAKETPDLEILARDEVCYEGDKVAVVAAEDPDIAEDALALIKVEYSVLLPVVDPVLGMAHDAPEAKLGAPCKEVQDEKGRPYRNVASYSQLIDGDVERAFREADAVVEREYRMPRWHQAYMEPNSCTAQLNPDGRVTLWTSCHGEFVLRDSVAAALKIPSDRIRLVALEMGGGFGAKNAPFARAHAVLLTMRTGRPVKMLMSREEEFLDGGPAPGCCVRLKTAGMKDGTITAVEGRIVWDRGYTGGPAPVNGLIGPYKVPNLKLEGLAIRTNKPGAGAYRAPHAPQAALGRECAMDALAHELGIDPVEIRLKNGVAKGDRASNGAPISKDWFRDTIREAAKQTRWGKRKLRSNQGMGVACGDWQNAAGSTSVSLTVAIDGSVRVVTGQVDVSGSHTVVAQVVSEELGTPVEKIKVRLGDTDTVPWNSPSGGSRSAYIAGTAAQRAAIEVRDRLFKAAAQSLEAPEGDLELGGEEIHVKGSPSRSISIGKLADQEKESDAGPISARHVFGRMPTYPSYSANIATVEVEPDTGRIHLIDLVAAQDVGKALNPMLVEGQIQGGAVQSVAYAMMEGYIYDEEGHMCNPNLLDYTIPTAVDVPEVKTYLVELGSEHGPYGAKGVGEPPIVPGAAAIVNAVYDAIGVEMSEIPLTPERVMAALREKEGKN